MFNAVAMVMFAEYLMDEGEIDEFITKMNAVSDRTFKNLFVDIHSSSAQEKAIRKFLEPYFDEIVRKREKHHPDVNLLTLAAGY